jgi:L-fucose isomerase
VTLFPIINKYGGKGAHVQFMAQAGEVTLGRLTRVGDDYKMTLFKGTFKQMPEEKLKESSTVWPHGFVAVDIDPDRLIDAYDCNHVHAIYGDHIDALVKFCEIKKIACEVLS